MIIWISGAYGVGKSTLAEALVNEIEKPLLFDAEEVGNAVRENYPGAPYGYIFEDYPLWGEFCYQLLKDIHTKFDKNILVPMTLVRQASYTNILQRLIWDGIDVHFIILEASHETIRHRILARGEDEDCWCMESIPMARAGAHALPGYHLRTDGVSVDLLAEQVLEYIVHEERSSL